MAADTGAILAVGLWLVLLFAGLLDLSQGAWELRAKKEAPAYVPDVGRSCIRFVVKLGIHFLLFVVALLALSDAVQLAVRSSRTGGHAESVSATLLLPTRTSHIKTVVRQAAPAPNPVPVISPPAAVGAQPPTRGPVVNSVATTAPPAAGADQNSGTQGNGTPGTTTHPTVTDPTLDRCAGTLERMLTVLLIEFILEVFFVVVRCIVSQVKDLRRALRKWLLVLKIAYAIPVVLINVAILWIGSGPNGACLSNHSAVRLAFANLLLYVLVKLGQVIAHVLESDLLKKKKPDLDEACKNDCAQPGPIGWGHARHSKEPSVASQSPASTGYTYQYEMRTADPPRPECRCCGLFALRL